MRASGYERVAADWYVEPAPTPQACEGRIMLPCGRVALIDETDIARLAGRRWFSTSRRGKIYVEGRQPDGKRVLLHRLLTGARSGMVVDHINGDGLDNRQSNLRVCSQAENALNARKRRAHKAFKGVFRARTGFCVQIAIRGKTISRGGFANEDQAARAYDALAMQYHGEFARLNFPGDAPEVRAAALAAAKPGNADKLTCKRGHPLRGDNLSIRPDGSRCCLACARARNARARNARKSAKQSGAGVGVRG